MLDLASAYIDMGDPESATNALEEVAASGSDKQRNEAQSLLDSVR
jgi:pilus assembly protein FimV